MTLRAKVFTDRLTLLRTETDEDEALRRFADLIRVVLASPGCERETLYLRARPEMAQQAYDLGEEIERTRERKDARASTTLIPLTPSLLTRVQALGYQPGETPAGVLPWLVAELEEARRELAAELGHPKGGADLGFALESEGWVKRIGTPNEHGETDEAIVIEDYRLCSHPVGDPYRRAHYRNGQVERYSFHPTARAAMRATP
jgi:hypothetical protein